MTIAILACCSSCITEALLSDKRVPYARLAIRAEESLSWPAESSSGARFLTCALPSGGGRVLARALPHLRPESPWLRVDPTEHAESLWFVVDNLPDVELELQVLDIGDGRPVETCIRAFDLDRDHPELSGYHKQRYAMDQRPERILVIPCRVRSIEALPQNRSERRIRPMRIEHSGAFDRNYALGTTLLLLPLTLAADAILFPFELLWHN